MCLCIVYGLSGSYIKFMWLMFLELRVLVSKSIGMKYIYLKVLAIKPLWLIMFTVCILQPYTCIVDGIKCSICLKGKTRLTK